MVIQGEETKKVEKDKSFKGFTIDNDLVSMAANPEYEPIELKVGEVEFQGKILGVWREV